MSRANSSSVSSVVGRRIRQLREELGWSQEKVGVSIGIDESSARARISRYELGVHEPPFPPVRRIAEALGVPLIYLYCEDDAIASLLLRLYRLDPKTRALTVAEIAKRLA